MAPALPAVLGNGVGGIVSAVGEGADPALAGTRVVTSTGGRGGYAQRCAVPAAGLIPVPGLLPTDEAVALLADGRTALALDDAADPRPGETVLIEAAAGGVGSLLVQLAKRAGARVVALAGGPRKLAAARALGADLAVDYREPNWAEAVRREAGPVDVVFDGVGGDAGRDAFALLRPSGRYAGFGMASGSFAAIPAAAGPGITRLRFGTVSPGQSAELTRRALHLAARRRAAPGHRPALPLDRAADAHAEIEARATIGKTLLIANAEGPR